ncbi:DivIVA domain-containing protein [Oscillospiraceae bacterium LTW-04]|nr:DivIVA domain-containing protein [Oscillospiraceae bacterium MB24-C1]
MLTPKEIAEKTFDKTFGFGYRMDDVNAFLEEAAKSMSELLEINSDLEKKLEVLADKLTEYREDEESLRTAILGSQKLGDSVIRESKTKAEIILRDATIKAEAMTNHAKRQIEREQDNLLRTQREVASFKNRLLDMYKRHLELISALPGQEEEEETETPAVSDDIQAGTETTPPQSESYSGYEKPAPQAEPEITDPTAADIDAEEEDEELAGFGVALEEEETETDAYDNDPTSSYTAPDNSKFGDMRFGEAFKIKRNSNQPKFKK